MQTKLPIRDICRLVFQRGWCRQTPWITVTSHVNVTHGRHERPESAVCGFTATPGDAQDEMSTSHLCFADIQYCNQSLGGGGRKSRELRVVVREGWLGYFYLDSTNTAVILRSVGETFLPSHRTRKFHHQLNICVIYVIL